MTPTKTASVYYISSKDSNYSFPMGRAVEATQRKPLALSHRQKLLLSAALKV